MKTLNTLFLLIALGFSSYVWGQGDNCATAVPVNYTPYLVNMNFTGDGPATGAGASNLGATGATNADWYSFTAPFNGTMEVNSCFGGADTRLTVLDGTCAALNVVGYSDDNCPSVTTGTLASQATGIAITAGTTYYIEWDDRWTTAGYDWNLIAEKTSCPDPSALVIDAVGTFDASASWTLGGNSYAQYGVAGFTPGTGTIVASANDSVNLTGLMPLTTYEIYVRGFCAPGDSSNWIGPVSFTTLPTCPAPTGLSSSNVINFSADINFTSMAGMSDIEYGPSGFMPGAGTRVTGVTASPHTLMLSAATSYDVYVRDSCAVNDVSTWAGPISFTTLTACPPPTSAMGVATSTSTADISWVSNATPSIGVAQVAFGPPGITPNNAPTTITIGSNPGTIGGLSPGTLYDFWLREVCDPVTASSSSWIGPFSFQTPCGSIGPASLPWVEDFAPYNGTVSGPSAIIGCGPDRVWTFENPNGSQGRGRVGSASPGTACGGPSSLTLDRVTFGSPDAINYAIVTIDMSAHVGKNINMNFDYEEADEIDPEDKIWARGDTSFGWVQIFDWNTGSNFSGTCLNASDIDVTGPLTAGGQTLGANFQIRIGQEDNDDWTGDGLVIHRIELVESTCAKPSAISAFNITGTSADISFAPAGITANTWDIDVVPTGNMPGGASMMAGVTLIPTNVTGLTPATSYDVYVREHCPTPGLVSDWEGPYTFMTGCPMFTAPYFEDFDALPFSLSNRDFSAICWSSGTNTSNTRWLTDFNGTGSSNTGPASDATGNGGNYMFTETSGSTAGVSDFLESPMIDVSGLASPSLIFAYHMYGATMGELQVEVNDGSGYVQVWNKIGEQHSSDTDPFTKASVDLSAFGDTLSVKFIGISGGSYRSDMAIDDVVIDDAICPPPSDLGVEELTLGLNNAELFWTTGGSNFHNVMITPAGTGTGFPLVIARGIAAEDYQVPPNILQPGVSYDFYVQDSCLNIGAGSVWVGPYTFTMFDFSCMQIAPYTEDFEDGGTLDSCWYQVQEDGFDPDDWVVNTGGTPSGGTGPTGDTTTAGGGGYYLHVEATGNFIANPHIMLSPPVNIAGLTYPELEFFYHMYSSTGGMGDLDVFIELPAFSANYVPVFSASGDQGQYWNQANIDLIPFLQPNDTIVRLAFLGTMGTTFRSDISFDQVSLHDGPACALPFNGFADNITTTDADLNWSGSASTFNVEYGTAGFAIGSGTMVNGVTATNTTIGSLTDDTDYEFYVQSDCGGGALSTWVGPYAFTTDCLPFIGDDITNPIVITSLPYNDTQNTTRCFSNQYANASGYDAADVFYEVTTSSNACAYLNISMCDPGTNYDGIMYLLDENGIEIASDDDGCGTGGGPSIISDFPVDANSTYYIVISGWSSSEGTYVLDVTETNRDLGLVGNAIDASAIGASDGSAWVDITDGFAPYTISWNTGDNTDSIAGLPAGLYLAAVTDANGCTDFIEVRVGEPCPADLGLAITAFDADSALTGGVVVTASNGTAPYTYDWDNGATTSVQTGIAGQVTYSVTVTDANGCTDSTSAFVGGVNTNQITSLTEYKLFPNPAVNQTQLQVGFENATDVSVELITLDGKVLVQELRSDVTNSTFNFDTSEFASGVYMVKVMADNQIMTKRLVVVKP